MNRRALRTKFCLKFCQRENLSCLPAVVGAQVEWINIGRFDHFKMRICSRDLLNLFKVIRVVGRDAEGSVLCQRMIDCAQEIPRDDPAPPVTPFWPRIGEQQIKLFDRPGWQQVTHGIRTFHSQQAYIANVRSFARRASDSTD